ncbi:DMT family transporter [Candidatus Dojkabacteria bacterium]|uniref:DMT family transporter n=1 Tax=Candidatus Dojkabacteria bacterium TaxID=2099670 RepID=A0A955RJT2_9BACT|nr:DMT family transporter [Candidatus Dojkabacteria bacterium]
MKIENKGIAFALLANFCWATLGVITRFLDTNVFSFLIFSNVLGILLYTIYYAVSKREFLLSQIVFNKKTVPFMITQSALGIFGFLALSDVTFPIGATTLILSSIPLVIVFIAPLVIKEPFSPQNIFIAILGMIGLILFLDIAGMIKHNSGISLGMIFAFCAFATNAVNIFTMRTISIHYPDRLVPLFVSIGAIIFTPLMFFITDAIPFTDFSFNDVSLAVYTSTVGLLIPFIAIAKALNLITVQAASIIGFSQIIIAGILGFFFFGETFTPSQLLGACIVLGSLIILTLRKRPKVEAI